MAAQAPAVFVSSVVNASENARLLYETDGWRGCRGGAGSSLDILALVSTKAASAASIFIRC